MIARPPVVFIDTSVLCNLLGVPGRASDRDAVRSEFEQSSDAGQRFVLPLTALVETGNFVAQAGSGRRAAADRYCKMLRQIAGDEAPWRLNRVEWGELLEQLLDGNATRADLLDLLDRRMGAGDVAILVERDDFVRRSTYARGEVEVWSLDTQLAAFG